MSGIKDKFVLYVYGGEVNEKAVVKRMIECSDWFDISSREPAGSYNHKWDRIRLVIETQSVTAAKRIRKAIGACSMGLGKDIYAVGNPHYKKNRLVDGHFIAEREPEFLFYCDVCGQPFVSRWPELVIVRMPKNHESTVVHLCSDCEQKVADILGGGR